MRTPVIDCGVQLLRGRLDRSSAGFEHNHVVPGSRKLNGYNNSDRAAADNDDVTGGQLRGRDLVKLQDHGRGNLRQAWALASPIGANDANARTIRNPAAVLGQADWCECEKEASGAHR